LQIDWSQFTPLPALLGGILVGLAAALLLLTEGHVLGAAGALARLVEHRPERWRWRLALIAGMIAAGPVAVTLLNLPRPSIDGSAAVLVFAGLLVGAGSRMANGCTSGHGVCGIARLSPRSLAATATFMATGFVTVFIVRHVLG